VQTRTVRELLIWLCKFSNTYFFLSPSAMKTTPSASKNNMSSLVYPPLCTGKTRTELKRFTFPWTLITYVRLSQNINKFDGTFVPTIFLSIYDSNIINKNFTSVYRKTIFLTRLFGWRVSINRIEQNLRQISVKSLRETSRRENICQLTKNYW
jgi:hypothetical protein